MKSPNLFVFLSPSNLRSTKQAELTKVGSLQLGNTYEVKNYIQEQSSAYMVLVYRIWDLWRFYVNDTKLILLYSRKY